jgi:hypothetical protein
VRHFDAIVTREGKWWMVAIPQIDGLTQARRLSEASSMARDYIAVTLDISLREVAVTTIVKSVGGIDVAEEVAEINRDRVTAAELERHARERAESLAKKLAARRVPVRDIGTMMGISFQRAHQLVTAAERWVATGVGQAVAVNRMNVLSSARPTAEVGR